MTILVWVDDAYGLIKWKMDLELGHDMAITFDNPDFVTYAESFGARGYRIDAADELLPTLRRALADDTVSVGRLSGRLLGEPAADGRSRGAQRPVLSYGSCRSNTQPRPAG